MSEPQHADEQFKVEVLRYSDLENTAGFEARSGLEPEQIRSMQAHPYARPEDPARVVLLRNNQRVAHIGLIPGRMRISAEEHRICWGSANWEFDGNPQNRAGTGLLLLIAMKEAKTYGGSGHSEFSRPIFAASRAQFLQLPRLALLLRGGPFLRRRIRSEPLARAAGFLVDASLGVYERTRRRWTGGGKGFRLEPVHRFGPEVGEIDEGARGDFWFPRDHTELNWAMDFPWLPADQHRYMAFHLHNSDGVVGYVLARTRSFRGHLLGSVLRSAVRPAVTGAGEALLNLLMRAFDDVGVDIADVCTSNPVMLAAARRIAMVPRRFGEVSCNFSAAAAQALRRTGATIANFNADVGEGDVIFA